MSASLSRLLAATAVAASLAMAPAASADRGPCIPGRAKPTCQIWTGTVGPVDDGDTLNVNLDGDGTARQFKVRLTGVQAMEMHSYSRKQGRSGECHAVAATERLENLIRGAHSRVRVTAIRASSFTGSRHRLRRSIAVKDGGRWVDAGSVMLREGLALWFPNGKEWAWNKAYSRLASGAARKGVGIWDTDSCHRGPSQQSRLAMKVKWDGEGTDTSNVNGEWARITNTHPAKAVSLRGWWFRDSHLRRYRFPSSASVPAGRSIRVLIGHGRNTDNRFYWGQNAPAFENVVGGRRAIGDGGYLFDRDGDLRAWVQYPCRVKCHEPLAGKVSVRASYRAPELVTIRNTSDDRISLDGYDLESSPYFYEFHSNDVLDAGEAVAVYVGDAPRIPIDQDDIPLDEEDLPLGDEDYPYDEDFEDFEDIDFVRVAQAQSAALVKSWGFNKYLLADRKDIVTLRNPAGAPVVCDAWGGERCPRY